MPFYPCWWHLQCAQWPWANTTQLTPFIEFVQWTPDEVTCARESSIFSLMHPEIVGNVAFEWKMFYEKWKGRKSSDVGRGTRHQVAQKPSQCHSDEFVFVAPNADTDTHSMVSIFIDSTASTKDTDSLNTHTLCAVSDFLSFFMLCFVEYGKSISAYNVQNHKQISSEDINQSINRRCRW